MSPAEIVALTLFVVGLMHIFPMGLILLAAEKSGNASGTSVAWGIGMIIAAGCVLLGGHI